MEKLINKLQNAVMFVNADAKHPNRILKSRMVSTGMN